MKFLILFILVLSTNIQAEVIKDDKKCDGTTVDVNKCLSAKIIIADKLLNVEYKKVMNELTDKKQLNLLRQSQKAWLSHISKEMDLVISMYSGGTFGPIRAGYMHLSFLEKRTNDLKELMKP